ncbi:NUDIX hydrolase [Nonomuraea wenchangensis]|uniref:NUDIX hydrolase n=1 Tax=Nonomuraea wenchangensis TaxID=568860 RepID=UPI003433F7ED
MRPLSERLARALESFDGQVVPARHAATVVLLRRAPAGPEVFLMRRRGTMAFASGMYVFPGGGVQSSDWDPNLPWLGPSPEAWGRVFGCPADLARALVVAAVRETFEETGVLLAGPGEAEVTGPLDGPAELRRAVESGELPFAELLHERGLFLRTDLLAPWAHWITPEFEPRRFDTRFFVSLLPSGQDVGDLAGEADAAGWRPLAGVIEEARAGVVAMMPPTMHVCLQLHATEFETLPGAAWARQIKTVAPRVVEVGGERFLDTPSEEEF